MDWKIYKVKNKDFIISEGAYSHEALISNIYTAAKNIEGGAKNIVFQLMKLNVNYLCLNIIIAGEGESIYDSESYQLPILRIDKQYDSPARVHKDISEIVQATSEAYADANIYYVTKMCEEIKAMPYSDLEEFRFKDYGKNPVVIDQNLLNLYLIVNEELNDEYRSRVMSA